MEGENGNEGEVGKESGMAQGERKDGDRERER